MGLENALQLLWGIVRLFDSPSVSIYWPYLLSASAIATVTYVVRSRRLAGALAYVFAPRVWAHRSVRHDLALFVINTLLYSLLFAVPLQALSTTVSSFAWQMLVDAFGPLAFPLHGPALAVIATLAVFVMADFAFFVSHVALHKLPVLWAFHKVHHSAPVLVPFTVFRRHPVDILFDGCVSGVVLGGTFGLLAYLGGAVPNAYAIAGVNALLFVCLVIGFNLQHSHVPLSFGPLDAVLICPAAHQIHHSDAPRHVDRNFGNMLSIWDRLLGTYVSPRDRVGVRFGCEGAHTHDSVLALYVRPFIDAVRRRNGNAGGGPGTTRT